MTTLVPRRRALLASTAAALLLLGGCAATDDGGSGDAGAAKPTLTVGGLAAADFELFEHSGIFEDAPYELQGTDVGFAEQTAALNAGTLDIALYGVTTALRQQAEEIPEWTSETAPVKLIAGFAPPAHDDIPKVVTAVRADAGIETAEDLRGKTWAFGIGGDTPTAYLASLEEAGLTEDDIVPLETEDNVAAFIAGQADVVTAFSSAFFDLLESGEAEVFYSADELGIAVFPGYAVLSDALEDPEQAAVIEDFLIRVNTFNSEWYDANPEVVKEVLTTTGAQTPESADFTISQHEGTRSIAFDEALFAGAEKSARLLYEAGDLSNPITSIDATFDGRFNDVLDSVDYDYGE
ncbi:ABC transporter substrate-binding protein [Leucobacter weissii]|uniref:ABC transporter substrate-binding protein n=1 Tax=Leucobacter weissii TaxID=1983706 RepID=A0A939MJF1_9MICO|nr:ABC transporter substrate-binding protein [Leucobacter weissii]MBO1901355.1 ABC transporter substrate-binding protein [Leucobacter weissii]